MHFFKLKGKMFVWSKFWIQSILLLWQVVFGVMTVDGADNAGGVLGRRNIEGKGGAPNVATVSK